MTKTEVCKRFKKGRGKMMDLKNTEVKEIARYFSGEVNNFLFKPQLIATEQKNSKDMQDLDFCWIKILTSNEYRTDLRNEQSAKVGRLLATVPFIRKRLESVGNSKMMKVAEIMSCDHRTLQQTFSSLIFYHLQLISSEEDTAELSQVLGDRFYMLPLI